jgi:hypothetical protein
MKYIFNIVERDIDFEVTAQKWADGIDGARFGNYKLSISIGYMAGVKQYYFEKAKELAKEYNLVYDLGQFASGKTTASTYMDVENLAKFICSLDSLYAFKLKKAHIAAPYVGGVLFASGGEVSGLEFSRDSNNRLNPEDLKKEITTIYLRMLKANGLTDSTVPQDVWDKYGPKN